MASEKNIFGQTNESNLHKVIRRVEEIWNRRFMHSNCVLNNTNKGQISKKSTKDGRIISIINKNIYPIKNSIIPKKRTYRKTNKNDKIIPEKLNMMQQREFGTLFQNEKSEKYKNEILNSTEKKNIAISKDNPLLISADLLEKSFHKKNLERKKSEIKKQLFEISSNTTARPNLKRNSSEEDEKVIKKPKVSSNPLTLNTPNDVNLLALSTIEVIKVPEKEKEVMQDQNTKSLDQYNAPSFKSPTSWYTSDTINEYIKMIVKRSEGEVYAVVTDFIVAYLRGGYPAVRRWIKKDIHTIKLLFVPMNVYESHWILTVVNIPEKTVTSYDSLKSYKGPYPMVLKNFLIEWEMDKKGKASTWTLQIGETSRQTNGHDCGPFTVELAEKMSRGDTTPINANFMPFIRLRHKNEIIAGELFN
ncbi:sentrin-specific protease 1-like isoform X1 [Daktulosphaira vitifoliae]|uniref:sentrin-specific protease 1-like isoform X1 n=3 Tax=Daktulosphaira vitifoliae TaxID=58002 RepID=UPI0021AA97C4|nr:sentrin-specific protease 1-like isoform X1 [Daktulosphaira vitifoliae]